MRKLEFIVYTCSQQVARDVIKWGKRMPLARQACYKARNATKI